VGIAGPALRKNVVSKLKPYRCKFSSFIHPSCVVASTARIGIGCILMPYTMVSENAILGDFSIVNCHSAVGHDACIGSYVTLSSYVDVTGHCVVEDQVFMGSGSRILPGKSLGQGAVIGAGAVAMRSVPSGRTLYSPPSMLL